VTRLIAFGLAAGAGLQAWRNFPPNGPATGDALAVVFALGVVLAYVAGRVRGRGRTVSSATSTAVAAAAATAESTAVQHVSLAVNLAGMPARESAATVAYPSDAAPWFAGQRAAITADDLDGLDAAELIETVDDTERPS